MFFSVTFIYFKVAVLSVFVSLAHGPNIPDLKLVSREMFRFIRPRTLPVPQVILVGWLVDWLVGWLVGWLVERLRG